MVSGVFLSRAGALASGLSAAYVPVAHMPFVGDVTYVANGHGDGMIVVAIAAICFVFALFGKALPSILGGGAIGALLVFFQAREAAVLGQLRQNSEAAGMFSGLMNRIADSVQIDIGFWIIAGGALLMVIGGLMNLGRSQVRNPEIESAN